MKTIKQIRPFHTVCASGPLIPILQKVLRRTIVRSSNIIIFLVFLSSCATMNINGVSMKKPKKRAADRTEGAVFIAGLIVGYAAVMHFKEPKKDK